MVREMAKAYCGFSVDNLVLSKEVPSVATGNWGCGVSGGEMWSFKAMLQWCAISVVEALNILLLRRRFHSKTQMVAGYALTRNIPSTSYGRTFNMQTWPLRFLVHKYCPSEVGQLKISDFTTEYPEDTDEEEEYEEGSATEDPLMMSSELTWKLRKICRAPRKSRMLSSFRAFCFQFPRLHFVWSVNLQFFICSCLKVQAHQQFVWH